MQMAEASAQAQHQQPLATHITHSATHTTTYTTHTENSDRKRGGSAPAAATYSITVRATDTATSPTTPVRAQPKPQQHNPRNLVSTAPISISNPSLPVQRNNTTKPLSPTLTNSGTVLSARSGTATGLTSAKAPSTPQLQRQQRAPPAPSTKGRSQPSSPRNADDAQGYSVFSGFMEWVKAMDETPAARERNGAGGRTVPAGRSDEATSGTTASDTPEISSSAKRLSGENKWTAFLGLGNRAEAPSPSVSPFTRPAYASSTSSKAMLPPKTVEEDRKHMEEYQRMLVSFQQKELARAKEREKIEKTKLQREEALKKARIAWQEAIPKWTQFKNTAKLRKLVWQGVPPSMRDKVWPLSLGNDLNINQELYAIMLEKSKKAKRQALKEKMKHQAELEAKFAAIFRPATQPTMTTTTTTATTPTAADTTTIATSPTPNPSITIIADNQLAAIAETTTPPAPVVLIIMPGVGDEPSPPTEPPALVTAITSTTDESEATEKQLVELQPSTLSVAETKPATAASDTATVIDTATVTDTPPVVVTSTQLQQEQTPSREEQQDVSTQPPQQQQQNTAKCLTASAPSSASTTPATPATPREGDTAKSYSSSLSSVEVSSLIGKENTVNLIPLDLPRTFPCLSFFQEDGPLREPLANILEAYVCYRPDIGYVQGMSYVAALMLLNMDEFTAFCCIANLLNRHIFVVFYRMDMPMIRRYVAVLDELMAEQIPVIYNNLRYLDITTDLYIMDWFLTIFSKSLPLDIAGRIWDNYFYEGDVFLYRTVLGLLKYLSDTLETASFDECLQLLTHIPQDMQEDDLFRCVQAIKISEKRWIDLLKSHHIPID
eukprot:TRINITY_DN3015_c0_g2_i4.p1 TRINITY_DN3015_c0_g2~~TRINITY_DN3015_c0_g2_i4.p1  ORF type:complete len:835 (-),score=195.61 TRINITY_DN3015_c0_g2_i4:29-2533(-)